MGFIKLDELLGEIEDDKHKQLYDENILLIAICIGHLAEELYRLRTGDKE